MIEKQMISIRVDTDHGGSESQWIVRLSEEMRRRIGLFKFVSILRVDVSIDPTRFGMLFRATVEVDKGIIKNQCKNLHNIAMALHGNGQFRDGLLNIYGMRR